MTFCLAMKVKDGIVGISDTRITSGQECLVAKKMSIHQTAGKHSICIMSSGLRSLRDKAITYFQEVIDEQDQSFNKLYKVANAFGEQVRRVAIEDRQSLQNNGIMFNLFALVAGQLEDDTEHKLYMIYPEGNWVEVGQNSPYFLIGNTGHGRPLLDRALRYDSTMDFALKVGFLSFNATRVSANDVEYPIDVVFYDKNSFKMITHRFHRDDLQKYSDWWQQRIVSAIEELPDDWVKSVFAKIHQQQFDQ